MKIVLNLRDTVCCTYYRCRRTAWLQLQVATKIYYVDFFLRCLLFDMAPLANISTLSPFVPLLPLIFAWNSIHCNNVHHIITRMARAHAIRVILFQQEIRFRVFHLWDYSLEPHALLFRPRAEIRSMINRFRSCLLVANWKRSSRRNISVLNYRTRDSQSISRISINLPATPKRTNRSHRRINNFQSASEQTIDFYIVPLSTACPICEIQRSTRRTIKVGHGFIQWRFGK